MCDAVCGAYYACRRERGERLLGCLPRIQQDGNPGPRLPGQSLGSALAFPNSWADDDSQHLTQTSCHQCAAATVPPLVSSKAIFSKGLGPRPNPTWQQLDSGRQPFLPRAGSLAQTCPYIWLAPVLPRSPHCHASQLFHLLHSLTLYFTPWFTQQVEAKVGAEPEAQDLVGCRAGTTIRPDQAQAAPLHHAQLSGADDTGCYRGNKAHNTPHPPGWMNSAVIPFPGR